METDLYHVPAHKLHEFIVQHVQPDAAFLDSCNNVITRLVHFLQNNIPGKLRPRRVIKSGSLGKGTAVRGKSDIDLILMLSSYSNVEDLMKDMHDILRELKTYVLQFGDVELEKVTKFSVQVKVTGRGVSQSVDILPGVDLLDRGSYPNEVYQRMNRPGANLHEYSVTLAPLQVEIIGALPTKVKDLIRIVKYWEDVKMKITPFIMDPTNPFNDMYHGLFDSAWDWDDVAKEATVWLKRPIFQNTFDTEHQW